MNVRFEVEISSFAYPFTQHRGLMGRVRFSRRWPWLRRVGSVYHTVERHGAGKGKAMLTGRGVREGA